MFASILWEELSMKIGNCVSFSSMERMEEKLHTEQNIGTSIVSATMTLWKRIFPET